MICLLFALAMAALSQAGCATEGPAAETVRGPTPAATTAPKRLGVKVVAEYPHDAGAYTQGLLWHEGRVYESTGHYGSSGVRRWQLGEPSPELERELSRDYFGEGLTMVGDRLIQLTWRAGKAFVWSLENLELISEMDYRGEGWGLVHDPERDRLLMSDGTHVLTERDPRSLEPLGRLEVRREGFPVDRLNELELAEGWLYANLYQTDEIVKIDPETGRVVAIIDASGLLDPTEARRADVLNGIAYLPETGRFLLTGKHWPRAFEVEFVEP